jgi:hypothetical protein
MEIFKEMHVIPSKHFFESHCNENPIYVFLFWELQGLNSPNFHIHVFVSDLYISRIGPLHIFPAADIDRSWEYINRSQTHEYGNWDCGRAIPFLGIFGPNFRYWSFALHFKTTRVSSEVSK